MSDVNNIHQRLRALPPKLRTPLQNLLCADHLSEDAATTILDAGELSGDQNRLLGFAVAYL